MPADRMDDLAKLVPKTAQNSIKPSIVMTEAPFSCSSSTASHKSTPIVLTSSTKPQVNTYLIVAKHSSGFKHERRHDAPLSSLHLARSNRSGHWSKRE